MFWEKTDELPGSSPCGGRDLESSGVVGLLMTEESPVQRVSLCIRCLIAKRHVRGLGDNGAGNSIHRN